MNLNNIKNKLVDLHDQTILHNLENYIYNIHRINKEYRFFKEILNKNIVLNEAEYVLYPNINKTSQTDKIFLSKTGKTLLYYLENVSEFILSPFDEEDWVKNYTQPVIEEEETITVTYSMIRNTCGWSKFCDVANYNHYAINEFGHYDDNHTFEITRTQFNKLW